MAAADAETERFARRMLPDADADPDAPLHVFPLVPPVPVPIHYSENWATRGISPPSYLGERSIHLDGNNVVAQVSVLGAPAQIRARDIVLRGLVFEVGHPVTINAEQGASFSNVTFTSRITVEVAQSIRIRGCDGLENLELDDGIADISFHGVSLAEAERFGCCIVGVEDYGGNTRIGPHRDTNGMRRAYGVRISTRAEDFEFGDREGRLVKSADKTE